MSKEIISCIDMQRDYAEALCFKPLGGIEAAYKLIERFSASASEDGIDTWNILMAKEDWCKDFLVPASAPLKERLLISGKFTDIFKESEETRPMPIVLKTKFSAFSNSNFDPALKEQNIDKIWLLGFHLDDCIGATAKDALDRGFKVGVIADLAYGDYTLRLEDPVERAKTVFRQKLGHRAEEIDFLTAEQFDEQKKGPCRPERQQGPIPSKKVDLT